MRRAPESFEAGEWHAGWSAGRAFVELGQMLLLDLEDQTEWFRTGFAEGAAYAKAAG